VQVRTDAAVLSDPRSVRLLSAVLAGDVTRAADDGTPENAVYELDGEDIRRPIHWLVEEGLILINEVGAPTLSARAQQLVLAWRGAA
jgi:hypothetical protein